MPQKVKKLAKHATGLALERQAFTANQQLNEREAVNNKKMQTKLYESLVKKSLNHFNSCLRESECAGL